MFLVSSSSCLCPIQWGQVISQEWRCSWSSANRRCSSYIRVIDNFISYKGAPYITDLTVHMICAPGIFTRGQFWPSGIVIACVCVSVSVSVCVCINHLLVRTITHQPFNLGSSNLHQRCKTPWLRSLFIWGLIDLDLQGQIKLESWILPHFELVRTITCYPFQLESPNLDHKCISAWLRSPLLWGTIDLDLQGQIQLLSRILPVEFLPMA